MNSAVLEWIDAETPHATVLRNEPRATEIEVEADEEVQAAIRRIEAFQARVTLEAMDQPLVVIEQA
jgi:hypothetical protein